MPVPSLREGLRGLPARPEQPSIPASAVKAHSHGIRRFDLLHRLLDLAGRTRASRWRSAASTRCGRRSTRTSPCRGARPPPGGGELAKRYYDVMDPFVTLTAAAAATKKLKVATGDMPGHPARYDPDGQARRLDRSGDRRAFPVRHRRRLEWRGDRGARHRLHHPHAEDARADGGDEGDLDQGRRRNTTARSSRCRRCRPGPSRRRSHIRRSCSAAPFPGRRDVRSATAMAGIRMRAAAIPTSTCPASARWRPKPGAIRIRCR